MGINLVVAVTDGDWFEMLRQQQDLSEVNFWSPSKKRNFKALRPGELFLFKLHAPRDYIVGGGIFAHANFMPCSLAWKAFGVANGARSAEEMRELIIKNKTAGTDDLSDFTIGCRILTQPFFFDEADWIPVPKSWVSNMYPYRTYKTSDAEGLDLWEKVNDWLSRNPVPDIAEDRERFGKPQLIQPRLGQGAFRMQVTDNYERRCTVTRERTLPALEAAHIKPYRHGGTHEVRNGLLLRSDIHCLFDTGYVTVTPDLKFEVSRRIEEEFKNGKHYRALDGHSISTPKDPSQHPDPAALTWHNEECFLG